MTDLGSALTKFDGMLRHVDGLLARGRSLDDVLVPDVSIVQDATATLRISLGDALPDGIAQVALAPAVSAQMPVRDLAVLRSELARLGAAARSVHELGGVESVVSQGGLDAIDGAVSIFRRHMLTDVQRQLPHIRDVLEQRPGGLKSWSPAARIEHLQLLDAAMAAPSHAAEHAAILPDAWSTAVGTVGWGYRNSDRAGHDLAIARVHDAVNEAGQLTEPRLPDAPSDLAEHNLRSARAGRLTFERSIGLPPVAPLATVADDADLISRAVPAFDRHVRVLEHVQSLVGDTPFHNQKFADAIRVAAPSIQQAIDDANRLRPMLADAPERADDAVALIDDWGPYLLTNAGWRASISSGPRMLPMTVDNVKLLRDELARLADDPMLAHARSDARAEVRELLERPGSLDVDALRGVLDGGDAPLAAARALVEHVGTLKPHLADGEVPASPDAAVRLFEEADLILSAVRRVARNSDEPKSFWLGMQEPGIVAAVRGVTARQQSALAGVGNIPDSISDALRYGISNVTEKLDAGPMSGNTFQRLQSRDLESLAEAATAFTTHVKAVTARAAASSGLREIAPSARIAPARAAQERWLLRELDGLGTVAADAPAELHVDAAARRLSTIADIFELARGERYTDDIGAGPRLELLARARSELAAIDQTWRFPDDVSLQLHRMQRMTDEQMLDSLSLPMTQRGTVEHLRSAAADLRAWSMLDDGTLPSTALDRLAVGARRADQLRDAAAEAMPWDTRGAGSSLTTWLGDLDTRLADVDHTIGASMPAAARRAVDEARAPIVESLEQLDELRQRFRSEEWKSDPAAVDALRRTTSELADGIRGVHAAARRDAGDALTW